MKKKWSGILFIIFNMAAMSQQKEGKIVFERTMQMQIRISDNEQAEQSMPRTRTDKFELLFGNNQSLWHASDEETPPEENAGPGIQMRFIGGGNDDVDYYNFAIGSHTEQRELFDKKFIITDSIRKLDWKLTGQSKTILDHTCQQAVTQRVGTRTLMNMDNGKMERKEVADTSTIVAWFAVDLPVSAGPSEFQGQLPGVILAIDINSGRQVFQATQILSKADIASIKEPKGGKKVSREEFRKETKKMMDEMEKNSKGGNRMMRYNN